MIGLFMREQNKRQLEKKKKKKISGCQEFGET